MSHQGLPSLVRPGRIFTPSLLFFLIVTGYGLLWTTLPVNGFWINDNGLKFIQLQAFQQNRFRAFYIPWQGEALDPDFQTAPIQAPFGKTLNGNLFVSYPPLFALISVLPYRLFGMSGLYLLPLLGAFLLFWTVQRLGETVCQNPARASGAGKTALLLVALASPVAFYSFTFWEHTLALAFCCQSLLAGARYCRSPGPGHLAAAGLFAGLAVCFRTDAYLFAGAVGLGIWWAAGFRWREAAVFIGGLLMVLVPLWLFQLWACGHMLGLHLQSQGWERLTPALYLSQRLTVAAKLMLNMHADPLISALLAAPFLLAAALSWKKFRLDRLPVVLLALAVLTGCLVLSGHLLSSQPIMRLLFTNGLFSVSPILILGFLAHAVNSRDADPAAGHGFPSGLCPNPPAGQSRLRPYHFLLLVLLANALAYTALVPEVNSMGLHWGCRFLLIAYPILCCLSAPVIVCLWYQRPGKTGLTRTLILLAAGVSLTQQVYALELLWQRKQFSTELTSQIRRFNPDIIITPDWYLPHDLAQVFFEQPIFLVKDYGALNSVIRRARGNHIDQAVFISRRNAGPLPENAVCLSDGSLNFCPVMIWRQPLKT